MKSEEVMEERWDCRGPRSVGWTGAYVDFLQNGNGVRGDKLIGVFEHIGPVPESADHHSAMDVIELLREGPRFFAVV